MMHRRLHGAVTERPKVTVLKTVVGTPYRGFESHPLRQLPARAFSPGS